MQQPISGSPIANQALQDLHRILSIFYHINMPPAQVGGGTSHRVDCVHSLKLLPGLLWSIAEPHHQASRGEQLRGAGTIQIELAGESTQSSPVATRGPSRHG